MKSAAYAQVWLLVGDEQRGMPSAVREMEHVRKRLGKEKEALLAPLVAAVESCGLPARLSALDAEHLPSEESRHDPETLRTWATHRARAAADAAAAHRSAPGATDPANPITHACALLWHRVSTIRGGRAAYAAALAKGFTFGVRTSEEARALGE